jgi:hypothetical protein
MEIQTGRNRYRFKISEFSLFLKARRRKIGGLILNKTYNFNMENFTAKEARKISLQSDGTELNEVIERIKNAANKGQTEIHIYNSGLKPGTINSLTSKGFSVKSMPSIVIQRDDLYHTITW